jgi:hypothetical protein
MLEVAERTFVEAVHQELDERWKSLGETVTIVSGKDKEVYTNFSIKKRGVEKNHSRYSLEEISSNRKGTIKDAEEQELAF